MVLAVGAATVHNSRSTSTKRRVKNKLTAATFWICATAALLSVTVTSSTVRAQNSPTPSASATATPIVRSEHAASIWQLLLTSGAVGGFVGGVIGALVGPWATHKFTRARERDAFVRSIADRYISSAQELPAKQGEFWRLGKLQDLGAAELNQRELRHVCNRIVSRGLDDPRKREISTVFKDERADLLELLRWASRKSISLHDGDALLRIHLEEGGSMFEEPSDGPTAENRS